MPIHLQYFQYSLLLTVKSSNEIFQVQNGLFSLKYHTNHSQNPLEHQFLVADCLDCPTPDQELSPYPHWDFSLSSHSFSNVTKQISKMKKAYSVIIPKVFRASIAPLPCENHARKMRTFFTRRLEPNVSHKVCS